MSEMSENNQNARIDTPSYSQFQFFRLSLPLPHLLLCILCRVKLTVEDMIPSRRGSRDRIERGDESSIRIGAVCRVVQIEKIVLPNGEIEEIKIKRQIPLSLRGRACARCQSLYALLDTTAELDRFETESRIAMSGSPRRAVEAVPFRYDPTSNLRLPTSISTKTTYRKVLRRDLPSHRVPFVDITSLIADRFEDPIFAADYQAWMIKSHPEVAERIADQSERSA